MYIRASGTAGYYKGGVHECYYNIAYAAIEPAMFDEVVAHEVCHAYTLEFGHTIRNHTVAYG
jgi:predicted SprT family Zn-dependent metalloprotease